MAVHSELIYGLKPPPYDHSKYPGTYGVTKTPANIVTTNTSPEVQSEGRILSGLTLGVPRHHGFPYGYGIHIENRQGHEQISNNIPVHLKSEKPPSVKNPVLKGLYEILYPYYQR